jgi:hypothetical protein
VPRPEGRGAAGCAAGATPKPSVQLVPRPPSGSRLGAAALGVPAAGAVGRAVAPGPEIGEGTQCFRRFAPLVAPKRRAVGSAGPTQSIVGALMSTWMWSLWPLPPHWTLDFHGLAAAGRAWMRFSSTVSENRMRSTRGSFAKATIWA